MSYTLQIKNGDYVRSLSTGLYKKVTGKAKTEQDCKMTLSTDVRDIGGIGCGLDSAVGLDQNNPSAATLNVPVMLDFQLLVRNGLERLRRAQRTYQFSQRTAEELIYDFSPVQFWPDLADGRIIRWKLEIITVSGAANFPVSGSLRS